MGRRIGGGENAWRERPYSKKPILSEVFDGLNLGRRIMGVGQGGEIGTLAVRREMPVVELSEEEFNQVVIQLLRTEPERFPTIIGKIEKDGPNVKLTNREIEQMRVAVYQHLAERGVYCPDVLPEKK